MLHAQWFWTKYQRLFGIDQMSYAHVGQDHISADPCMQHLPIAPGHRESPCDSDYRGVIRMDGIVPKREPNDKKVRRISACKGWSQVPCFPARPLRVSKTRSFVLLIPGTRSPSVTPLFPLYRQFSDNESCSYVLWVCVTFREVKNDFAFVLPTGIQVFPLRVQTHHAYDLTSPRTHTTPSPPKIFLCSLDEIKIMQHEP